MNFKILVLSVTFALTACGVALRDKSESEGEQSIAVAELVVENEYSLPVPKLQSQQLSIHYERLVLKPGAQFITQGVNAKIEVDELITEGGTIRSFKADQIAPKSYAGRSGGHLELILGHVTGGLLVEMRGEQGGKGDDGPLPNATLKGPTGPTGGPENIVFANSGPIVAVAAKDGGVGFPGLPGFSGGEGKRGGDSGTALIKILEGDESEVKVSKYAGQGGVGGDGGAGGEGGEGGAPGQPIISRPYTVQGPRGPQGPQGPVGPTGPAGLLEKVCIEKDSVMQCE
jgi:hypothetical protein